MPELIDRKYLLAYLAEIKPDEYVSAFGEAAVQVIGLIEEFVKEMPTIEPEVRHGRWITLPESCQADYECSECGAGIGTVKPPYCAYCGTKMDGGAENESE